MSQLYFPLTQTQVDGMDDTIDDGANRRPSVADERLACEVEYVGAAFNYKQAPIGSRDWTLFFAGWLARSTSSMSTTRPRAAPAPAPAPAADPMPGLNPDQVVALVRMVDADGRVWTWNGETAAAASS